MSFSVINYILNPKLFEYYHINSESDQTKWKINQKMFEYFMILILIIILSIILLNFRLLKH
jgi:hypothetical protein